VGGLVAAQGNCISLAAWLIHGNNAVEGGGFFPPGTRATTEVADFRPSVTRLAWTPGCSNGSNLGVTMQALKEMQLPCVAAPVG